MTNTNAQRAKVYHGTLERTSGGLTKKDLKKNEYGKIVSKRASSAARKNNNLGAFKKTKKGFQLSPAKGTKDYKDMLSKKSGNKSKRKSVNKSKRKSGNKSKRKSVNKSKRKSGNKSKRKSGKK